MNEIEKYSFYTRGEEEPSDFEMYCWFAFVMMVGFAVGFMVGVS